MSLEILPDAYINFTLNNNINPCIYGWSSCTDCGVKNVSFKRLCTEVVREMFVIKETKDTESWTYVTDDIFEDKIAGTFYEN